jgi:hypothetical protein
MVKEPLPNASAFNRPFVPYKRVWKSAQNGCNADYFMGLFWKSARKHKYSADG